MIPIDQIRAANVLFIQKDSLQGEVDFYKYQVASLDSAIIINQAIILEHSRAGTLQELRISNLQEQISSNNRNAKKANLKSFITGSAAGAFIILLISLFR